MKTKLNLTLLTALFASFALVSCDQDPNELFEGEWPFTEEITPGGYSITFDGESRNQGYVRAFTKIENEEYGINRADEGDEVWIRASAYNGFEFLEWIATNVTLSSTEAYEVKFTMPASDVSFEAVFDDLSKPKATPYELENVTIPAHKALEENVKLRAWKAAQTRQVFTWFDAWSGRKDEGQNSMRGLPKEVSIIANWGQPKWNLAEWQRADMKYVQEVLGTKVVFTLFSQKIGDDVEPNALWTGANAGITSSASTDEATVRPAIAEYARQLYLNCYKEGYDGYDWDFEPGVGGIGTASGAPLWKVSQQSAWFLEELSFYFGPNAQSYTAAERTYTIPGTSTIIKRGLTAAEGGAANGGPQKRLLLCVDGEVHNSWFNFSTTSVPQAGIFVDYYVQQAYGANTESACQTRTSGIVTQQNHNITASRITKEEVINRCILTENWENSSYATSGGGVFVMATYKHEGFDTGGFGAYRVGLGYRASTEAYNGSIYYAHLRKAIDLQYGTGAREL